MERATIYVDARVARWFDARTYLRGTIIDADPRTGNVMVKWDIGLAGWHDPLTLDVLAETPIGWSL